MDPLNQINTNPSPPVSPAPVTDNPTDEMNNYAQVVKGHPKGGQRWWIIPILAIFITGVVGAAATIGGKLAMSKRTTEPQTGALAQTEYRFKATAEYVEGKAWKGEGDSRSGIAEEDILGEGDTLTTESNSRLVLLLDDGSVVRMSENSQITLSELKTNLMRITEKSGSLFARVNKDQNHKFLVQAGDVTVESIGTAFLVENTDEVKVKVWESTVKVIQDGQSEVQVDEKEQWNDGESKATTMSEKELTDDKFLAWNLTMEKEPLPSATPKPTPKPTAAVNTEAKIVLYGMAADNGVKLSWTLSGTDSNMGFKIMKALTANPSYPESNFVYVNEPSIRMYKWDLRDGQTWNFRVCKYVNDRCELYSNNVSVTAPNKPADSGTTDSSVKSIQLKGSKTDNKASLVWTVDGTSTQGFKVVWSTEVNPTYPGDSYHYYTDSGKRDDVVEGLESGKTYYFRVCEYLGGKCGVYSNELSLSF